MNPYVGIANSVPDSRTPRRFASVMKMTNATDIQTRESTRPGAADVIA